MRKQALALLALLCVGLGVCGYHYYPFDGPIRWNYAVSPRATPAEENGYYAYIGLAAPDGTTAHAYGFAYVEKLKAWRQEHPLDAKAWRYYLGAYRRETSPSALSPPAVGGETFDESVTSRQLGCWLVPKAEYARSAPEAGTCASEEALSASLAKNARLLENFAAFLGFAQYDALEEAIFMNPGVPILPLSQLYAASLVRQAQVGDAGAALDQAVKALEAQKKFRSGNADVVLRSVISVMPFAGALRAILFENPQFAPAIADQAWAALVDDKSDPVAGTLNGEYAALIVSLENTGGMFLSFRPNATKAAILRCAQALADAPAWDVSESPTPAVCEPPLPGSWNDIGTMAVARAHIALSAIWKSTPRVIARLRAQALFVRALAAQVPPAGMAKFLAGAPLLNPLTQKPFLWDSPNNGIYYGDRDTPKNDPYRFIFYPTF